MILLHGFGKGKGKEVVLIRIPSHEVKPGLGEHRLHHFTGIFATDLCSDPFAFCKVHGEIKGIDADAAFAYYASTLTYGLFSPPPKPFKG